MRLKEETDAKHISDETAYKFVDLRDVKSAIADIAEDIIYEIKERIEDGEEEIDVNDVANNVEESYFDTDKEMHIMIAGKMARDMSEDEVIEVLKEADPEFEGIFEGDGEDESDEDESDEDEEEVDPSEDVDPDNENYWKDFSQVEEGDKGEDYNGEKCTITLKASARSLANSGYSEISELLDEGDIDEDDDCVVVDFDDGESNVAYVYGPDGVVVKKTKKKSK